MRGYSMRKLQVYDTRQIEISYIPADVGQSAVSMYTSGLLSCLPRCLFRPVALVLLPSLLLASCGSPGRIVTVYPIDAAPARGRLIALHDGCAIIDTTCGMLTDLRVQDDWNEDLLQEHTATWKVLERRSVRIDTARMDQVFLEGEYHVGSALLIGLGITAVFAIFGALGEAGKSGKGSLGPEGGAVLFAILGGIPTLLISLIAGITSSHGEDTLHPGNADFRNGLEEATAVSAPLPAEADSLSCDNDLR